MRERPRPLLLALAAAAHAVEDCTPYLDALHAKIAAAGATGLYAESDERNADRRIRVSREGTVEGYADIEAGMGITVNGLVADDAGVWLFGRGVMEGIIGDRVWVERVVFDR